DKYIRDFISERCRILAVIGLHVNVFKPHTGTKTSVLLVQKWDDDLCPRLDDYPIFFATMHKPGKDNSGEKVYVKNSDGSFKLDEHKHFIVEHDLFNHEGRTQDGIAEAFIEFAKREHLSFFVDAHSFDAVKYEALMSGLEASEVMLSEYSVSGRLDSEYYSKAAITTEEFIMQKPHSFLKVNEVVSGPFGSTLKSSSYMEQGDIAFIRVEDLRGGFHVSRSNLIYISHEDNSRLANSQLYTDDLILSKVGSIGFLARVDDELKTCNISENNIGIKLSAYKTEDKHTMLAYFNSRYGQILIQRRKSGNVQPKLNVKDMCCIPFPIFSDDFSRKISSMIIASDNAIRSSMQLYTQAQNLLPFAMSQDSRNTSIKSFSEVFMTGRLDSEYFMPKYDSYNELINSYENGTASIASLFTQVSTKCARDESSYRYVEIGDVNVGTGSAASNEINTGELPDNAKIMTRRGDVLVSKVRPNRGAVAILDDDNLLVSGAFTVLREKTGYRKEVLQVLLRSELYRELLMRFNVGTSYPVIKDEDVLNLPVPLLSDDTQTKIALKVQESFTLRRKSEELINLAVKCVELAIESGEETAIKYINNVKE
ncbi:MAG: hypothetical protein IJT58_05465, partial [Synergistaceae bacterium]|nr:hypothetical protein [Synergistaceae bacterium]